jgi:tRNA dimethylallyltransferase
MPVQPAQDKPKVIAVVGPTASGKSALGIYLAKKLGGEVISADSRQVYKGLDVGTGKVTKHEMESIPHHLLSIISPKKIFTASDFVQQALHAATMIYHSGHTPIVVGGTGFYIDAFLGHITLPNVQPDLKLRTRLEKKSVQELYHMLKTLDPRRARSIEPEHKRRLIRAIEIAKALGKSPPQKTRRVYDTLWLGLNPQNLRQNIHTRLLRRERGMIAEAKRLHRAGLSYRRMEELGLEYRYLARLLQNKISKEEFFEQLEREIQKYAKRQMRWFKRNKNIYWVKSKASALQLSRSFLSGR